MYFARMIFFALTRALQEPRLSDLADAHNLLYSYLKWTNWQCMIALNEFEDFCFIRLGECINWFLGRLVD